MAETRGDDLKVVVGERNFVPHRELFESLLPASVDTSWHAAFDEAALDDLRAGQFGIVGFDRLFAVHVSSRVLSLGNKKPPEGVTHAPPFRTGLTTPVGQRLE